MPDLTQDPKAASSLDFSEDFALSAQTQIQNTFNVLADTQVSPNAPVTQDVPPDINKEIQRNGDLIKDNCLNDYVDVTYGVSLAMVSLNAVKTFALKGEQDSSALGLSRDEYIVFASTGESDTDPNAPIDYYNIQAFNFSSFLGHVPQNPMTAIIWDGKMRIFEPHGFSLREDIEKMRQNLGYDPVAPWHFTYRLEVWFSGWNPKTGQWVRNIPIPVENSRNVSSIVYFLTITTIEAKVTTQGTEYELSFQMYSHKTLRADAIIYRLESQPAGNNSSVGGENSQAKAPQSTAVTFGGSRIPTFGDFLQNLLVALKQQVFTDTEGKLNFIYNFYAPQWLLDARFDQGVGQQEAEVAHSSVSYDASSGVYTYASRDIDIFTLIARVMDHLPIVRQLFLRSEDPGFTKPKVSWNIRTNIQYTPDFDSQINSYKTYTLEYFIEPVLSFRSGKTEKEVRNQQAQSGNQKQRADAMAKYGMITRIYDFFFTNDNSEVIDLDFTFKFFYQEAYPKTGSHALAAIGQQSFDQNVENRRNQDQQAAADQNQSSGGPVIDVFKTISQRTAKDLGIAEPPQSAANTVNPAYTFGDLYRGPELPASTNLKKQEAVTEMKLYLRAKDQYYRYDMIDVVMTVRFDPVWLLNPYLAGGDFTPKFGGGVQTENGSTSKDLHLNMDRVVYLDARAPVQSDFMNPARQFGSSQRTPILGGFYQVISVVNVFDGGKFIQRLNMFKYPHLNGYGQYDNNDPGIQQSTFSTVDATTPNAANNPTSGQTDSTATQGL